MVETRGYFDIRAVSVLPGNIEKRWILFKRVACNVIIVMQCCQITNPEVLIFLKFVNVGLLLPWHYCAIGTAR